MKLRFSIHYRTEWGQQMMVCLVYHSQDGTEHSAQLSLTTQDGDQWEGEMAVVESRRSPIDFFTYYYIVADGDSRELRREWTHPSRKYAFDGSKTFIFSDKWRDIPLSAHLYTAAYEVSTENERAEQETADNPDSLRLPLFRKTVLFRVSAPQLRQGQGVAVVGSHPALGSWNPARYLPMESVGRKDWMLALNVDWIGLPIEYKYVVIDQQTHELLSWEEGDNRIVDGELAEGEVLVLNHEPLRLADKPWRVAGVCIPVFSLRSEHSCGVGDFGDLCRFVDWAEQTGMRVIQLLPVNDTTKSHGWSDSYPYNIVSAFALHPHYLDLEQLGTLKNKKHMTDYRRQQRELNALDYSDYEAVERVKMAYVRELFEEQGEQTLASDEFKAWRSENSDWLEAYTAQAANGTLLEYIQFQLHRQLRAAADYARSKGIFLKGDLPIGVNRDSIETAQHPDFFRMEMQAGAPPDAFSMHGQNWGFPTYRWGEDDGEQKAGAGERIEEWFHRRLQHQAQYFDALRIDHVLGFFRIWEIPVPQKSGLYGQFQPSLPLTKEEIAGWGLPFREELYLEDHKRHDAWHPRINALKLDAFKQLGDDERQAFTALYNDYFYRRNNNFWYQEAMKKLPRLTQATRMLVCAEDLGMVPDCVPWVMNDLRILSLEIQSMPKTPGLEFGCLQRNPYRSVATISTHDMSTLRQWWDEDEARTQRYYNNELRREGPAPHPLSGTLAREIVARHLVSPSMLCLLSLQDWLAIDEHLRLPDQNAERINIPANPRHYWRYRMHLNIEQLMQADNLNHEIRLLIRQGGRMLA